MSLLSSDFDQPGLKESNAATFRRNLDDMLTTLNHRKDKISILTSFVDKYMPKYLNMKLLAGVYAMLIINTDKSTKPNLQEPYSNINVKEFNTYINLIISDTLIDSPTRNIQSPFKQEIYILYMVDFMLYLQHIHNAVLQHQINE
jgi:hypothetical protein